MATAIRMSKARLKMLPSRTKGLQSRRRRCSRGRSRANKNQLEMASIGQGWGFAVISRGAILGQLSLIEAN